MIRIDFNETRHACQLAAFLLLLLSIGSGCFRTPEPIRDPAPPPIDQPPAATIRQPDRTVRPPEVPVREPESARSHSNRNIAARFVDVAHEAGIDFTLHNDAVPERFFLPEVMGGGAAWIDLDGDGWLDLFLANGCTLDPKSAEQSTSTCRLWRNRDGERFEEITDPSRSGVLLYGQGCAVGDFDADGFPDLYIAGYGPDRLLHNQGDGTFVDATEQAAVSNPLWTSSALWIDVDGDRDLDLYAVNYVNLTFGNHKVCDYGGRPGYCGPGSYDAVRDCVYLNLGDGTFVEAADRLGLRGDNGKGLAVAAADFDDDLIPEIYVANDMTANFLFQRRAAADGPERNVASGPAPSDARLYRETAAESGCAVSGSGLNEASMGISLADFDGDGRCDIYLTHYFHMKNTLYRNLGGLVFDDISNWARVTVTSHESLGFGTAPFDYDRDGDPDLFVANGHVLGPHQQPNAMTPQLLRNDGGMFTDVSSSAGHYFNQQWLGRSVAAGDYDNDGDIDLAVTHLNAPFALLRNETPAESRPFLGLHFIPRDRCHPVGGRIVTKSARTERTIPLTAGGSYLAAPDTRVLVNWGEDEPLESLDVYWPSGCVDRHKNPTVRRYANIVEGRPAH
jgi:enediyne biosynthesis protein E4